MKQIIIGKNLDAGKDLTVDVDVLLKTRLLVQANSGGGKSWAIRKIIEETNGKVHQIILDIEDDFSNLREKFDFVLVGKGGDIPADPRSAELLARKVLELRADVIVNLYELRQPERIRFVKVFLDAMVNSPKDLWHPALIILDEAHLFAPEGAKSESLSAVIDMESRGRKRGFCLVPATQRLSKLHKDVAAECQNKLIGLANMDLDRKRASEEIGFNEKGKMLSLRDLDPGEFYAVGPAFGRGVSKVKIGNVKTSHHEAGSTLKPHSAPVATGKVKQILAKLTDLPKEAEEELRDKQSMMAKIRELERAAKTAPKVVETKVEKVIDPKAIKAELQLYKKQLLGDVELAVKAFQKTVLTSFEGVRAIPPPVIIRAAVKVPNNIEAGVITYSQSNGGGGFGQYGKCERAILKFLAMRQGTSFSKVQIGAMTEYAPGSGSFNNSLSKLAQSGLIARQGDRIQLIDSQAESVKEILGSEYLSPEPDAIMGWLQKLGKCERSVFEYISANQHDSFSKEEIGEMTGYAASSGSFNNAISKLNTLGLIQRNSDGTIGINKEIVNI